MCSVQGEINLLCWRTRSIKIPLKVFHLKNPFSENMSHNWHLWLRNWLWRKKKAQHPIQMPTRCTTLPMSQHEQKTFNTVQIHVHDLSFFSVSWAKYIVPEICGNTCLFYCLLYPAWLVECFFFFFPDKRKFTNVANSVSAQGSTKDLWKCSWIVAKYFNMSQYH